MCRCRGPQNQFNKSSSFCCLSFSLVAVFLFLRVIFCIANVLPRTKTSQRSYCKTKGQLIITLSQGEMYT